MKLSSKAVKKFVQTLFGSVFLVKFWSKTTNFDENVVMLCDLSVILAKM